MNKRGFSGKIGLLKECTYTTRGGRPEIITLRHVAVEKDLLRKYWQGVEAFASAVLSACWPLNGTPLDESDSIPTPGKPAHDRCRALISPPIRWQLEET